MKAKAQKGNKKRRLESLLFLDGEGGDPYSGHFARFKAF